MAVKSAADPDPFFAQRRLAEMKQRTHRQTQLLGKMRKMTRSAKRPAFLDRAAAPGDDSEFKADKLVDSGRVLGSRINKHIDSRA